MKPQVKNILFAHKTQDFKIAHSKLASTVSCMIDNQPSCSITNGDLGIGNWH